LFSAYPDFLTVSTKQKIHDAEFETHWTPVPIYLAARLDYLVDCDVSLHIILSGLFNDTLSL